jgi:hypothetical protein
MRELWSMKHRTPTIWGWFYGFYGPCTRFMVILGIVDYWVCHIHGDLHDARTTFPLVVDHGI